MRRGWAEEIRHFGADVRAGPTLYRSSACRAWVCHWYPPRQGQFFLSTAPCRSH